MNPLFLGEEGAGPAAGVGCMRRDLFGWLCFADPSNAKSLALVCERESPLSVCELCAQ